MIKAFSGVSRNKDSFEAGREAAAQAVAGLAGSPEVLWVFGAVSYDQQRLLQGVVAAAGDVPFVGCSTDGEISCSGLSADSVVVLAVISDTVRFHTACAEALSDNSFQTGVRIGEAFAGRDCRYLQIFSDGITGNAVRIIAGIKSVMGEEVMIAGGAAGDGGRFAETFQYHDGRVLTDSVTAVAFEGEFSLGTSVGCGWFPVGTAKTVTRSEGNILYELDGQPALPIYEKFLGRYASKLPMVGVEYPLGLVDLEADDEYDGYFLCRATMGVDRESQSIRFAGDIPQGCKVKMTMGNEQDLLLAASKAAVDALAEMRACEPGTRVQVVFLYSCMARKIVLGSRTAEEIDEIRAIVGPDVPIIGFYTYGEYAPIGKRKKSGFHNETITLSVVGNKG